jgi:hypothetical protein
MEDIIRLDRVSIFRDQLSFLIPRHWVEGESEEDCYLYHAPPLIPVGYGFHSSPENWARRLPRIDYIGST